MPHLACPKWPSSLMGCVHRKLYRSAKVRRNALPSHIGSCCLPWNRDPEEHAVLLEADLDIQESAINKLFDNWLHNDIGDVQVGMRKSTQVLETIAS